MTMNLLIYFLYDNFFITLNADGTTYDLYDYQGELLIDDALDISELTNDLLKVIFNDTLDNYVHLFNLASKTFDDESYSDAMMVMDNQYIYVEKIDQDDTLSGIIDLNFEEKHPLALQSYDSLVGNYLFYVKDTIEYIYHIPSETFIDLESDEIIDIANDLIIALPNGEISNQLFDENGLILTHEAYQTIMNDNTATLNHITYAHDQYYVINDASTDVLIYDYDQDQSYVFDNLEELNYQQSNDDMFLFSGPTDPSVSYLFMLDHANQIMTSTYEPVSTSGEFDGSYFIDQDDSQLYYKFDSINFYSYADYYIFDDQKHFTLYSQTYSEFYVVDENDNIIKISDYLGEFFRIQTNR